MTPIEQLFRQIDSRRGAAETARYLAQGGDIHAICPGIGWTLLHVAADCRNLTLIRTLIKSGANPDIPDPEGWTPLHVAADSDVDMIRQGGGYLVNIDFAAARLLIRLGADPSLRTHDGRTPRDIIAAYGAPVARRYDELALGRRVD